MVDLGLELEWWHDSKGYRLIEIEKKRKPRTTNRPGLPKSSGLLGSFLNTESGIPIGITAIEFPKSEGSSFLLDDLISQLSDLETRLGGIGPRLVRAGGDLVSYRPLADFDGVLYSEFARSARSPQGALDFINRFGPLTRDGLDPNRGENVSLVITMAQAMHHWIAAHREGTSIRMIGPRGVPLGEITATLTVDPMTGQPRVQLTVNSLLAGLWLQLGHALSGGAKVQQCLQCGELFQIGPGTGRRLDAKFCSDQHRIDFNSLKRTKETLHA